MGNQRQQRQPRGGHASARGTNLFNELVKSDVSANAEGAALEAGAESTATTVDGDGDVSAEALAEEATNLPGEGLTDPAIATAADRETAAEEPEDGPVDLDGLAAEDRILREAAANPAVDPQPEVSGPSELEPDPAPWGARSVRPARKEDIPSCPPIGTRLTCDDFSEVEDGLSVVAEVRDYDDREGSVLLWLPALGRRWPIASWVIRNGKWQHFPGDYPPAGHDPKFDARYRQRARSAEAPAPAPKPRAKFKPPREARPGHVWVEVGAGAGMVNAIGFDIAGARKIRDWAPGDKGEIEARAVADSPHLFQRL